MASAEFALIHRFFDRPQPDVPLAVGDDCALLKPGAGQQLAVSTDTLVSGVHFFAGVDPFALGHKALAVNLSDLAAMGATPRWFTLALTLPGIDEAWIGRFAQGLNSLADAAGIRLVGGDTTRGPLSLTLTVLGEVPDGLALRRDGARAGDDIWVSGTLGDAALALKLLGDTGPAAPIEPALRQRLERPEARVDLGVALRGVAHAAIDLSDGLLADLGHVCSRSGLGATLCLADLPLSGFLRTHLAGAPDWPLVLAGGDDYELCFTAPSSRRDEVQAAAGSAKVSVTRIGEMRPEASRADLTRPDILVVDALGKALDIPSRGYDHFASS